MTMKKENNSDLQFQKLFASLGRDSENAPEGLKETILQNVLNSKQEDRQLSLLQRFFFIRPLVAAGSLACVLSLALWGIFGDAYLNLLSGFLSGVR
jgi:hypothetical protein